MSSIDLISHIIVGGLIAPSILNNLVESKGTAYLFPSFTSAMTIYFG